MAGEKRPALPVGMDGMIVEWLSNPIVWAAGLSFCIGAFGYVLFGRMLWPLWRYRRIKGRIQRVLDTVGGEMTQQRIALRECAGALTVCHNDRLPYWYRLVLQNRGESPLEAAGHLMTLANVKRPQDAKRRMDAVRRALGLTAAVEKR
jgi:hypothetical protein